MHDLTLDICLLLNPIFNPPPPNIIDVDCWNEPFFKWTFVNYVKLPFEVVHNSLYVGTCHFYGNGAQHKKGEVQEGQYVVTSKKLKNTW